MNVNKAVSDAREMTSSAKRSCNLSKGLLASRQYNEPCSKCEDHHQLIDTLIWALSQNHFEVTQYTFTPAVEFISSIGSTTARHTCSAEQVGCRGCFCSRFKRELRKWHYTTLSRHVNNNAFVWMWACVSADQHHRAPGDATLSKRLLQLVVNKAVTDTFFISD